MEEYYQKLSEIISFLKENIDWEPEVALVLGSGLGGLERGVDVDLRIPFEEIPHFPKSTIKGHGGELIFGTLEGKRIVVQSGRYHFYEGYDLKQVTMPIRIFGMLNARLLLMASAVGGIHEDFYAGDVTVVNDHINLMGVNPLRGTNDERLGPRFPDMSEAYHRRIIASCHEVAKANDIVLHDSTYACLQGPNLETKAEYNYLNIIGATVVGMSTVPEIIVAKHMGLNSCVLTAVTNKCFPISEIRKVTHDDVIGMAEKAGKKISIIFRGVLRKMNNE